MKQKTKIFKIILLVVVIAIMVAVTIYLIPTFKELSSEAGQQAFKQKVNDENSEKKLWNKKLKSGGALWKRILLY